MPINHKLGFGNGSLIEYEDGTVAYRATMTVTEAFRVAIADVTGFSVVKNGKALERTLNVLGRGSTIASVSVNHGTSERIEEWFRSHPSFGANAAATASAVHAAAQNSPLPQETSGLFISAELENLAKLRDAGVLTNEEFDQRKALLLSRT